MVLQSSSSISAVGLFLLLLIQLLSTPSKSFAIRTFPITKNDAVISLPSLYSEAPNYRNGINCSSKSTSSICDSSLIHVAITLDISYLRGSIAAVHSILRHTTCPDLIFFHFITTSQPRVLSQTVRSSFPSLNYKIHIFRDDAVKNLISTSIRSALENPLNYARNYLGEILPACVSRVVYLDSDLILVDDVVKLWSTDISFNKVIAAPEYCHANFTKYFNENFWKDGVLSGGVFSSREKKPCYFNTGVMVIDLVKWREGHFRKKLENWMELQRVNRIYELGSLPPFLLVFGGDVEGIDHRWNQHGLGGDNVVGSCRAMHPGPVSLLHWSGKGKPWVRFDEGRPCPLDYLWKPYDLFKGDGGRVGRELGLGLEDQIGYSSYLF